MATADIFRKIIEKTDAERDCEHLHILIDNNTDIPDRTACIIEGSDAPALLMSESAKRLESMGADLLIIPCNTAHFFHGRVSECCGIPVLHMPRETAEAVRSLGIKCAGLLATEGTLLSGIYDGIFEEYGIELRRPSEQARKMLMHIIYNEVKAGRPADTEVLEEELCRMEAEGCEAFILACTELPIAFAGNTLHRFIDPTSVLAEAAITAAGGKLKR
ncbi:MAG: amino acid racemase [Oscillospiraceae bacterium]|nr:amino acid racemase [Oscillospiraceae bacterium]